MSQEVLWRECLEKLGSSVTDWYKKYGRDLPWRQDKDAYKIWISEIMLQQTRIEAVKPYYARFMEALPDMQALAGAEEERLLKLWEGLGYYSRARNLKKCAVTVMEQYDGQLPEDYEALKKLPGIGPYTAGAIASLAYGIAVPAVDGNVLRVLSRVLLSREDISQAAVKKKMEQQLAKYMPKDKPGEFNEGIMELGETVCIPNGRPLCENCPLQADCLAYRFGMQEELPVKAPKKARRVEERTVLILLCEGSCIVGLRKRPDKGLLSGMYELPAFAGRLDEGEVCGLLESMGLVVAQLRPVQKARHIFSHVEWDMTGWLVELAARPEQDTVDDILFVEKEKLRDGYPLPAAFRPFESYLQ